MSTRGNDGASLLATCREALERAGAADVEIYARLLRRGAARFSISELSQHMEIAEPQALIRVADGTRVAEASTSELSVKGLLAAIDRASRACRVVPETEGFAGFADAGDAPPKLPTRFTNATANATCEERTALLAPVLERIRREGLVSAGMLETNTIAECVATTRGCKKSHDATTANFKVWALETAGSGGAAGYGGHVHTDVRALRIEEQTDRALRICKLSRDPISLEAGAYDVVMEPEAVSELVEWLGAIAFGAAEIDQGSSPLAGRIGTAITGPNVTIVEDPHDASDLGFGSAFDREGTYRTRVPLIENGIARAVLYDRTYAARAKAVSTGNAVAGDMGFGSPVSPTSLSMLGGTSKSVDDLIAGVRRGLYVCRLHYVNGFLETRRAVMTGLTRDGAFLIENGRITRPVGNMRFTGSFLEALSRCDAMTEARSAIPTWWSAAGACVVPSVRMREFIFNGKSQERATYSM